MEVTLQEAMRIRRELTVAISKRSGYSFADNIVFGDEAINDEVQVGGGKRFDTAINELQKLLDFSLEVGNAVDQANKSLKITDLVREKVALNIMYEVLTSNVSNCSASRLVTEVASGTGTLKRVATFTPYVTKLDLKIEIKGIRKRKRAIETEIAKLDGSNNVTLSFDYDDLEEALEL